MNERWNCHKEYVAAYGKCDEGIPSGSRRKQSEGLLERIEKDISKRNGQRAEYGPNDILKINLAHAVMLSAVYEACDPKPDIDAMTKFYRELFLRQRIILAALKRMDMLKPSEVRRQRAIGERSQKATHPFT